MAEFKNIQSFVPLNSVVKQAALDTYDDLTKVEARYTAWAVRGIKKLTRETLKSGKRFSILNVNQNLNNAQLPCDFKEEIFVGIITDKGEKIALNINPGIVSTQLIDEIPCDAECKAKCGCYPTQLCCDIERTQVINKILINDTYYDETVTTTLNPTGEYYVVTTTPVLNMDESGIDYITRKEYVTNFDVADCGCIKQTERNDALLEHLCYDLYCCYCTPCCASNTDFGGYRIFLENGIIQFDMSMKFDKVYMEYRGCLPKDGNEFLIPEVAVDTLTEYVKYKSIANKRGVPQSQIATWFDNYTRERSNMTKVLGRMSLNDILHSALLVPKFDYNTANVCASGSVFTRIRETQKLVTNTVYVDTGSVTPLTKPWLITVEGTEMTGGMTYNNSTIAGASYRIFSNVFNRFLTSSEYTDLPTGGFILNLGTVYGAGDFFDIMIKSYS